MMSGRLSGKVCVITGTGGSVGRAAALAFAREGASVVGCDVNVAAAEATVEMVRAQGGTMISLQPCHLTEPSECQALVDLAVREYGRIARSNELFAVPPQIEKVEILASTPLKN